MKPVSKALASVPSVDLGLCRFWGLHQREAKADCAAALQRSREYLQKAGAPELLGRTKL